MPSRNNGIARRNHAHEDARQRAFDARADRDARDARAQQRAAYRQMNVGGGQAPPNHQGVLRGGRPRRRQALADVDGADGDGADGDGMERPTFSGSSGVIRSFEFRFHISFVRSVKDSGPGVTRHQTI